MSTLEERKEILKNLIKLLHTGISVDELKSKYGDLLSRISPLEIPLIEQELVKEGLSVKEILSLCDLHVALFRESLAARELKGVPNGHPIDLLMRENELLMKLAEAIGVHAQSLAGAKGEEAAKALSSIESLIKELKKVRSHYRKNQMLIFPYLEKRGITAVPRVLWGREDQVIVKIRELEGLVAEAREGGEGKLTEVRSKSMEVSQEVIDLVFRENKILYPASWVLLSEGEWAAVHEVAKEMGYIVEVEVDWTPKEGPIYPYQVEGMIKEEQTQKLPAEFRATLGSISPDAYEVRREDGIEFSTGFLSKEEVEGVMRSLPLELTFADANDRVKFYSESILRKGFLRAKTILGRKLQFCHPPRLESYVMLNVNKIKSGELPYREFWTKLGERLIRVIVVGVRNSEGRYLGTLEVVEDLTEVLDNPEEVRKRIMVL
ncbi:MAG: DUF438 domain-containing protein [Candidatus Korarchaeum sp.]|nr:DUF438 domain-containing protein [Candidatus Korarchaeum sp.]MDW8036400.1 DUF438 domain-containing protein [Candidatus Korarchaeum sp.]